MNTEKYYLEVPISDHPTIPSVKRTVGVTGYSMDHARKYFTINLEVVYTNSDGDPVKGLTQPSNSALVANNDMQLFVRDINLQLVPNPDAAPDETDPDKKYLLMDGYDCLMHMRSIGVQLGDGLLEYFITLNDGYKFFDIF